MLSAKQAAEATGVSKQAIIRAIKRGTISASKDIHGEWTIDAAELFRHYQPLPVVLTNGTPGVTDSDAVVHTPDTPSVDTLREKVILLERILETKDDVISAKEDTIMDLRARLNVEQEERRRLTMLLTATTTSPPPAHVEPTPPPRSWWERILGK